MDRFITTAQYCDHPAELVAGLPVVSRSAVALAAGMSGEEVEAAMQAAKQAGLQSAHALDVDWLRARRPALVLTQDTCRSCVAGAGGAGGGANTAAFHRRSPRVWHPGEGTCRGIPPP